MTKYIRIPADVFINRVFKGNTVTDRDSAPYRTSIIYVYRHLIPYIPEVQIVHNKSPETTNYIARPLLKIFLVQFNFPSLIAENFRVVLTKYIRIAADVFTKRLFSKGIR